MLHLEMVSVNDEQRFGTNLSVQYDEPGAVSNALLDALNYPDKGRNRWCYR